MADYWKSTPKYWCKHCSTYVADTKLGRANHEATGKHQGAVKRALRDLHRDHERQEREQERAKREVARLNGIVGGSSGSRDAAGSHTQSAARPPRPPAPSSSAPLATPRAQLEQLADLGVAIPDAFRGDLAMAGEWTVTTTRVIKDKDASEAPEGRAVGVRKRRFEDAEDERDEESNNNSQNHADADAAVQGLFKRTRQWGRDSRILPGGGGGDDGDLDGLLSSAVAVKAEKEVKVEAKAETKEDDTVIKQEDGSGQDTTETRTETKTEPKTEPKMEPEIKTEDDAAAGVEAAPASVLFKKRKAKATRHK